MDNGAFFLLIAIGPGIAVAFGLGLAVNLAVGGLVSAWRKKRGRVDP